MALEEPGNTRNQKLGDMRTGNETHDGEISASMTPARFRRRFLTLILLTWTLPPVVGLSFILFIGVLSWQQMAGILTTPIEPVYILGWLAFAVWYFPRAVRPIADFVAAETPGPSVEAAALQCLRTFPFRFWSIFLFYLLAAPASVILSAEFYTDFVAQPVDWFRIALIALIVSIIVGLPIFFLIYDLFGCALSGIKLPRPYVAIKAKVFLIGALVPLLIDTMLVQYYWTRTGYFTFETFLVWLSFEMLAIGGSLIFVRSFGQSLSPLQKLSETTSRQENISLNDLLPQSTDELGLLANEFRDLLGQLKIHNELLDLNNRILRNTTDTGSLAAVVESIVSLCQRACGDDLAFLLLHDTETDELVGVAQTGMPYKLEGHYRLSLNEPSMAVWVFKQGETTAINSVASDPRVSARMRERFQVKSALAVPLRVEGRVIGVLMTVAQRLARAYTQRDEKLLENVAREAALAIHTHQLVQRRADAERERCERDEFINLLLDSTEEAIYGVDLQGVCTFVNHACVRMLGYDNEAELIGKNIHEFVKCSLPGGAPCTAEDCELEAAVQIRANRHSDQQVHWRRDGTQFPVEYWSRPILKDGAIVGSVVTFIDISERRGAEAALRETQKMLQLVLDTIPVRVFWKDLESVYLGCNKLFAEDSGLHKPENVVGKNDFDMGWSEQAKLYRADDLEVTQSGIEKLDYEEPQTTPGGEKIWLETSKIPLTDQNGEVIGILGTYHDITDRKRTAAELVTHRAHLEHLVAERTAELQAVNKELEAFSYSVSHDLRSPLRAIDGFSLALLEEFDDALGEEGSDYLKRIRGGAQRMSQLIDDILQLSRVTRSDFKLQIIDLSAMAAEILGELEQAEPNRRVKIIIDAGLEANGDDRLIRIVLENLLGNAWKYTGKAKEAAIEFRATHAEGNTTFFIRDNGVGFDMRYAEKLFGAFQRLHRVDEFEGTGIGLATVQRIIHRHGGRVWAEADLDKGATFYFLLP